MFGLFEKKEIIYSKDYFDDLKSRIAHLEDKVKRLELKQQLKPSGELKILGPVPKGVKGTRRKRLNAEEKSEIENSYISGWKCKDICHKYDISASTFYKIIAGKNVKLKEGV